MSDINEYDYNHGIPPKDGLVWSPADEDGPGRWAWETNGVDTQPFPGTNQPGMIVWPKRPNDIKQWYDPKGYQSGVLGIGWSDYSLDGVSNSQNTVMHGYPFRATLNREIELGEPPGWTVYLYEGTTQTDATAAARKALDQGLASGLPDATRAGVVPFARLDPDPSNPEKISRIMTVLPLGAVTDVPASSLPAMPGTVNVQRSVSDIVQNGKQYLVMNGGKQFSVPVVDAAPVKDKTPQTNRYVPDVWQAVIAPGLPAMIFATDRLHNTRLLPQPYGPDTSGMHVEIGSYGPSGYTSAANNGDVIIRFPASTGASPIYVSTIKVLDQDALNQRQIAENTLRNRAETAAKEEVARREEEARRAEELRRAEATRKENYAKAGVLNTPFYTPDMVKSAGTLLGAPGAILLNRAPGMIQLSAIAARVSSAISGAASAVMTGAADLSGWMASAVWRAATGVAGVATVSTAGVSVAAVAMGFWPGKAGGGDDSKVPGRDINMLAAQARLFTAGKVSIEPGMTSVNLPVRGFITTEANGKQSLMLVKTGQGGVSATVPVLSAVRDTISGLDKIKVPSVAGVPGRTILINPVPIGPTAPSHTGNSSPVPVTPVHTGTDVKQADSIVTTTLPAADIPPLQDFIYWQPDATGTGVEPIYVVMSGIYGETNAKGKSSGRPFNTDRAGGPIQSLDWKTAVIDREGVNKVKLHTGRFTESDANKVMIERLEKILSGELNATDTDKRYYTHEIRELERYRNLGVADGTLPANAAEVWNNTHTATLEDYKLGNSETLLYTPEALKAAEEQELRELK